jgi:hypothetical protein
MGRAREHGIASDGSLSGGAQERSNFRRNRRVPRSHGFEALISSIKQHGAAERRRPTAHGRWRQYVTRYRILNSSWDITGLAV